MTEFTLYCFQCIPFRMNFPKDKDGVMFREEMEAVCREGRGFEQAVKSE